MSELLQKKLMSKHGLLHPNIARFSSRHWLDFLVHWQSSKSSDICARTFDTLKRYSVTELVKDREENLQVWLSISAVYLNVNVYVLCKL